MGSRYNGADRSRGGYQSRSVDEEERESERQAVLGAFAEAVNDASTAGEDTETDTATGAEESTSSSTGGSAAGQDTARQSPNWAGGATTEGTETDGRSEAQDHDQGPSPNWPGAGSSGQPATEGRADDQEQSQGTSANWPAQRETLSESDARGVVRNPESMTEDDHRAAINLLEQAHDRGAPLAAMAGEGFDDEVHGWLSVVSGHEDLSRKTKRRARETVGWLFV